MKASFLNYIVACDDDCHDDRLQDGTEDEDNDNFGNGKGMKKSIPKIREREGNEKRHSRNSGTGRE